MSRRVSLPGADELFRSTARPAGRAARTRGTGGTLTVVPDGASARIDDHLPDTGERRPSGRERHDEKITVYLSEEELIDLEQARLLLRSEHGLAVDRGRIVREAVAVVLSDLDARGEASILVQRLRGF